MQTKSSDLTIVLPTRNRPHLLRRSLAFYSRYGLPFPIAVADSSDPEFHAHVDGLCGEFPDISISVRRFPPDYNSWLKIIEVMELQQSRYIGLSGDDDVLIAETLVECVSCLDQNPDVSVVDGREVRVALPGPLLNSHWGYTAVLHQQRAVNSEDPLERLVRYFQSYWPTFYGVHRRDSVIEAFRSAYAMGTENLVSELMQGAVTVLNGCYKCIGLPYIMRQVYHNQSTAFDSWQFTVDSEDFARQLAYFRAQVQAKFPDDPRVPGACDLAIERFLQSMLPNYDFRSSGHAVDGGLAAIEYEAELGELEDLREEAQILTPPQLRAFADQAEKTALVTGAHLVVSAPGGVYRWGDGADNEIERQLDALPRPLSDLLITLCLDGFGHDLRKFLEYCQISGGMLTYQSIFLNYGHTHYSLPVIPECILTTHLAAYYSAIPQSLALIEAIETPEVDIDRLVRFLKEDFGCDEELGAAAKQIMIERERLTDYLAEQLEKRDYSSTIVCAGLLAVFAASSTIDGRALEGSSAFVKMIAIIKELDQEAQVCFLSDFARISFAALQGHLLLEVDWEIDIEKLNDLQSEALFWAAEYGGTLLGTGSVSRAQRVLGNALRVYERSQSVHELGAHALYVSGAHILYHSALLQSAVKADEKAQTYERAVAAIEAAYGPDSWMLQALSQREPELMKRSAGASAEG